MILHGCLNFSGPEEYGEDERPDGKVDVTRGRSRGWRSRGRTGRRDGTDGDTIRTADTGKQTWRGVQGAGCLTERSKSFSEGEHM
jgi:hypothetical protein